MMKNAQTKTLNPDQSFRKEQSRFILLMALGLSLMTVTACSKYEEGPALSLRSKTERVANDWKISQAKENGKDVTGDYAKYELALSKGGEARLTADYSFMDLTYQYVTQGTWDFASDKEKLSFNFENDDADGTYKILKLKEDEMWLLDESKNLELHFITR